MVCPGIRCRENVVPSCHYSASLYLRIDRQRCSTRPSSKYLTSPHISCVLTPQQKKANQLIQKIDGPPSSPSIKPTGLRLHLHTTHVPRPPSPYTKPLLRTIRFDSKLRRTPRKLESLHRYPHLAYLHLNRRHQDKPLPLCLRPVCHQFHLPMQRPDAFRVSTSAGQHGRSAVAVSFVHDGCH